MKTEGIILNADCRTALKEMPANWVDMTMFSPPYWGLRNYGVEGQLGLEATPQEYVIKLCDILDDIKRVTKPTGTCWVNFGDTYGGRIGSPNAPKLSAGRIEEYKLASYVKKFMPKKSLCLIPSRFAIEMTDRGWILRNEIIWHKPNCTPSSIKDRFTPDYERIFFFTKSTDYYFEQQFEPLAASSIIRAKYGWNCDRVNNRTGVHVEEMGERFCNPNGRNMRSVWSIPTKGYDGAHFATYPEDLCEVPIKAGCPEFICRACGKPRRIIREKMKNISQTDRVECKKKKKCGSKLNEVNTAPKVDLIEEYRVAGMTDCGCNCGFSSGIVLDPFAGTGTTLVVAKKLGRKYVGIELNPEYCRMIEKRLNAQNIPRDPKSDHGQVQPPVGEQSIAA